MNSPFNNVPFTPVNPQQGLEALIAQARQNPQAFAEQIKRTNPAGYQRAMQIMNSPNPQALIMQMAQARGISPNIYNMLGIK